jgi:hypothetical protein
MILVEQKIRKSSGDLQHLILYKLENVNTLLGNDIYLKYYYNKKLIFNIELFEYYHVYYYNFLDLDDYVNNIEDFFNSFFKVKEYIRLFLIENVDINKVTESYDESFNKDIYSFFIKEYELFL